MSKKINVLFVCLGNICRSPLAEGAFQALVDEHGLSDRFMVDSAGTNGYHDGESPDIRSIREAQKNHIDISHQLSRQIQRADLERFDYIIAMDRSNLRNISRMAENNDLPGLSLMMDEVMTQPVDVPDPYYGGADGFAQVWAMVHSACSALLNGFSASKADYVAAAQHTAHALNDVDWPSVKEAEESSL